MGGGVVGFGRKLDGGVYRKGLLGEIRADGLLTTGLAVAGKTWAPPSGSVSLASDNAGHTPQLAEAPASLELEINSLDSMSTSSPWLRPLRGS